MTTKLEHSITARKTYWAILNRLVCYKKIPAIPSQATAKKEIFLITLLFIYAHLKNNSVLPPLLYKTKTRIKSFHVTSKDILSIIKSLDSSKSH